MKPTPKLWIEIDQVVQEAASRFANIVIGRSVPDDGFNPSDQIIRLMWEAPLSDLAAAIVWVREQEQSGVIEYCSFCAEPITAGHVGNGEGCKP